MEWLHRTRSIAVNLTTVNHWSTLIRSPLVQIRIIMAVLNSTKIKLTRLDSFYKLPIGLKLGPGFLGRVVLGRGHGLKF